LEINLMFLGSCMVCYSTLKMEAVYSFWQLLTIRCKVPTKQYFPTSMLLYLV
jgi:hypothetical protein